MHDSPMRETRIRAATVADAAYRRRRRFPSDYRNAVEWYQYDPTKWVIAITYYLGLASELRRFPRNEIDKGQLQMQQKALNAAKAAINWGPDPATLPVWSKEKVATAVKGGAKYVILDGFVLDVAKFMGEHPGGTALITTELGNDITEKFKGGYYTHSCAARNLQATFRVARVAGYW